MLNIAIPEVGADSRVCRYAARLGRPIHDIGPTSASPWHDWAMKLNLTLIGALALAFAVTPAMALSLTSTQVGEIYCAGRLSGDMAPVIAILTPELAALVAEHLPDGAESGTTIPWQSSADYANSCMPVGASGTADTPEIIIAFGYNDPNKAQYADKLVMRFIDKRLRIDDIAYGHGGTLRQRLGGSR